MPVPEAPEPPTGVPVPLPEPAGLLPEAEVAPEATVPPVSAWVLPEVTLPDTAVVAPELTMLPLWLSELPLEPLPPEENEHALAAKQKMGVRTLNERRSSERTVTM